MKAVARVDNENKLFCSRYKSFFYQKIMFTTNVVAWKKPEYWATLPESMGKGLGDCDDFAIAKYFGLRLLGIQNSELRLVYVRLTYFLSRNQISVSLISMGVDIESIDQTRDRVMSLIRQLWAVIAFCTLMGIVLVIGLSTRATREHLQNELSIKNQDTANALAIVLSQRPLDITLAKSFVAAYFSSGHFAIIDIRDINKNVILEQYNDTKDSAAPLWFSNLLPMKQEEGVAQMHSGWRQIGSVHVTSTVQYADGVLWNTVISLSVLILMCGAVVSLLALLILRQLHGPIKRIVEQAQALSERRSIFFPDPKVPELRQLWLAMNAASSRLQDWIDSETSRVEQLHKNATIDRHTGLINRDTFFVRFKQQLAIERTECTLLIARLGYFKNWQKSLGWQASEAMLEVIGLRLQQVERANPDCLIGRIDKSEFAAFTKASQAPILAQAIQQALIDVCSKWVQSQRGIWLVYGYFTESWPLTHIIGQLELLLTMQQIQGENSIRSIVGQNNDTTKTKEQWEQAFAHAQARGWIQSSYSPVLLLGGNLLHLHCSLRMKYEEHGSYYNAPYFMKAAHDIGLAAKLDVMTVAMALSLLNSEKNLPGVAIELSAQLLTNKQEISALLQILKNNPAPDRLWLEIDEHVVLSNLFGAQSLFDQLRSYRCLLGIRRFGHHFNEISHLTGLGLQYVRLDSSFVQAITTNENSRSFIQGVAGMTHNMDLMLLTEEVNSEDEAIILAELGVNGAGGSFIRLNGQHRISFSWPPKSTAPACFIAQS
jgi:EAL domain-containing protein (putative c-di-GMP-specific phosphodiesterase class I)